MTSVTAVLLALLGTPLFVIIAALAAFSFWRGGIDLTAVFIEMYRLADMPALSAIPMFAFTGFLLAESDAARRLVRVSETLLSWLPGGLAIMALAACALLTAFTGASGMTIVALGGLLYPALRQSGYPENFSLGLLTTAGSRGLLFPPSIAVILYGIVSGTPIDRLFIAAIAPGMLLLLALAAYCYAIGRRHAARPARVSLGAALTALREFSLELLLPVVIVTGIFGGFIAISEAAALSALYVFIVFVRQFIRMYECFYIPKLKFNGRFKIMFFGNFCHCVNNLLSMRNAPLMVIGHFKGKQVIKIKLFALFFHN